MVYMYAYAVIEMKKKCELASVSHEKKVEMRFEKERVVVYDEFLRGKGLRFIL